MAHSYYSRLTLVHPQLAKFLDPRVGYVIAETASTGRFILSDISWESAVAPNADTTVAYHATGELKIYEPLGMSLFDYIKAASFKVGLENHLDARFLLEIEVTAEDFLAETNKESPYKYVWPIMVISTDVKSTLTERGTEYIIKFVHTQYHAQTDLVQPYKDALKIKTTTLGEYFEKLQIELESREFKMAAARQKAGSGKIAKSAGKNPAAADTLHDEYHFILDPEIKNYQFTSKGSADPGVQQDTSLFGGSTNKWQVTLRPGTTILAQITTVLKQTKKILGDKGEVGVTGSSQSDKNNIEAQLGKPYKFFRVETQSIYKDFDYIRGRYAVKHVFFIFLSDQPNMYNFPDELDLINRMENKERVLSKLKYYIQEGLLQKLYYHNYTGLNTDILKVDLQFNQSYALPSYPIVWKDYAVAGQGAMNLQNYDRNVSVWSHEDRSGIARALQTRKELQEANKQLSGQIQNIIDKQAGGDLTKFESLIRQATSRRGRSGQPIAPGWYIEYQKLQQYISFYENELKKTKEYLDATGVFNPSKSLPQINKRSDLFLGLKDRYIEDEKKFKDLVDAYASLTFPNLRPRMEPDTVKNQGTHRTENEYLIEKLFSVQISPRDLVELELEIIADPYWLGAPNILVYGKQSLDKINFPKENEKKIKEELDTRMKTIDPEWATRPITWGDYGVAPQYKGAPLFYFTTQMPDSEFTDDDLLKFNNNDQIAGIYMVKKIINSFKDGKWTQKLISVRDITIPTHIIPRGTQGELTFEQFMDDVNNSSDRVADKLEQLAKDQLKERQIEQSKQNLKDSGRIKTAASQVESKRMLTALEARKRKDEDDPMPTVSDPIKLANEFVAQGKTRSEAAKLAHDQFEQELKVWADVDYKRNMEIYKEQGIADKKPWPADVMVNQVMKNNQGGLQDWVNNFKNPGPAILNNPMGVGYDKTTKSYYEYETFTEGLQSGSEYYNYSKGVQPVSRLNSERLLLPSNIPSGKEGNWLSSQQKATRGN